MVVIRAAAARMAPVIGDPVASRAASAAAIEAAAAAGATLVVLPELANSGCAFADRAEAASAAESIPGLTTELWSAIAERHGIVVVGGLCERDEGGLLRDSSVVVDGSGVLGIYRKLHLWGHESRFFVAGERPAPVVETAAGRIGLAVCYDLWFPEQARGQALAGADILTFPANLTGSPPQRGLPPIYVMTAIATAHVNRVHLVLADRCGDERGEQWLGASVVVDAHGVLLDGPPGGDGPALALGDLDLDAARDKRWGPRNDLIADRRPAQYERALTGDPEGARG